MLEHSSIRGEGLQKLTDRVYGFIGREGDPNHGFIVTEKGVVVIDNDIRDIDRFLEAIRKITRQEIKFLINTHHAFDHTSANQIFAELGATIISSSRCREYLAETGEQKFAEMGERDAGLQKLTKGIKAVLPDIAFDQHLSLHLGSNLVELIFLGHCHSPGDSIVYLPQEKILFAGDLLMYKNYPNLREGNVNNWIIALDRMYAMPVEFVVPGHGLIVRGKEEFLVLKEYFLKVKSKVEEEAKAGKGLEEIRRNFSLPECRDWGKSRWLTVAIEKIYRDCAS